MSLAAHNILALDIAFGPASACLIRRDGKIFTAAGHESRPHSQAIMPQLSSLLGEAGMDWAELDMLAAGIGPGSFTGLRIAAATLAGINSGLKLPMLEISSLAISASQADCNTPLHVIEDGRSGLAYFACYEGNSVLSADACLPWNEVKQLEPAAYTAHQPTPAHLPDWTFIPARLSRPEAMARLIEARTASLNDTDDLPRFATPAYLIPSQAERNAQSN